MRAMSWLRNILKVASSPPSSSTPNFGGEDRCHGHGDSEVCFGTLPLVNMQRLYFSFDDN